MFNNVPPKGNRREVMWFLISSAGLLGVGSSIPGYKPVISRDEIAKLGVNAEWALFPWSFVCIDPEEGRLVKDTETLSWETIPHGKIDLILCTPPIKWGDLQRNRLGRNVLTGLI